MNDQAKRLMFSICEYAADIRTMAAPEEIRVSKEHLNAKAMKALESLHTAADRAELGRHLYWNVPEISAQMLIVFFTGKQAMGPPGLFGHVVAGKYDCGHDAVVSSRSALADFNKWRSPIQCPACREREAEQYRQEQAAKKRQQPQAPTAVRDVLIGRDEARNMCAWLAIALDLDQQGKAKFLAGVLSHGLQHGAVTGRQWKVACDIMHALRDACEPEPDQQGLAEMEAKGSA